MAGIPTIAIIDPRWHGLGYVDAALAKGYRVIPIVYGEDRPEKNGYAGKYHDLIIADLENFDSIIKAIEKSKHKIDAIVPGNDYFPPMTARVAAYLKLKGQPYEASLSARLKDLGRKAYDRAGIPNVKYEIVGNLDEALGAAKKIGYPVVLKPSDCSGSEHVTMVNNDTELADAMKVLMAFKENSFNVKPKQLYLIEEYIGGQEFSVELFIQDKRTVFASVTEKISSLPRFIEIGHVVPTSVYKNHVEKLKNVALQAVLALGFSDGPFHVELRLSPRGPIIMETNGRVAGGLIATDLLVNAFGINLYDIYIESLLGRQFSTTPTKNKASSIAQLIVRKKGRVISTEGIENLSRLKNVVKYNIPTKTGDMVYPTTNNDERLGYIITVADTPEEAKQSAFDAINSIKLNLS